jgi:hypothetical protein
MKDENSGMLREQINHGQEVNDVEMKILEFVDSLDVEWRVACHALRKAADAAMGKY